MLREADARRSLINRHRKRHGKFSGTFDVIRREKLDHLVKTRNTEERQSRIKRRQKMLDGMKMWSGCRTSDRCSANHEGSRCLDRHDRRHHRAPDWSFYNTERQRRR